jgi:transposase
MDNGLQVPLNLPDVRVRSTQRTEPGHGLICVESPREGAQCRRCGWEMRDLHGLDAAVRLRSLPLFDVPVFVDIRPKRYDGPDCAGHPTTTPRCAWYEARSPHTKAYEPWAWRLLSNATVADAARQLGVSAETSDGILDRWIAPTVAWGAWERLGGIGIDEVARTRGHREVVVLVTVPREGGSVEMLAVLADRQKETVVAFLRSMPEALRRTLERACMEMDEGVVRALEEDGPWAEIVIARFHSRATIRTRAPRARCGRGPRGCGPVGWSSATASLGRSSGGWTRSRMTSTIGRHAALSRGSTTA